MVSLPEPLCIEYVSDTFDWFTAGDIKMLDQVHVRFSWAPAFPHYDRSVNNQTKQKQKKL